MKFQNLLVRLPEMQIHYKRNQLLEILCTTFYTNSNSNVLHCIVQATQSLRYFALREGFGSE